MSTHPKVCVCVGGKMREMNCWCQVVWPQQCEIIWLANIMNEALCKSVLQLYVCVCGYLGIFGQCLYDKKQKELYIQVASV